MWDEADEITTAMLSGMMLVYLFSAILFMPGLQKQVKRDAGFMGERIADGLDELIAALEGEGLRNEQFALIWTKLCKVCW